MEPPGALSALLYSTSGTGADVDWLTRYPELKSLYVPVSSVRPTGKFVGSWAWGVLQELEIDGHRTAAGKRLDFLLVSGTVHPPVPSQLDALVGECLLLSELRHPNIVQFLGVCSHPDSAFPVLMTEVLSLPLRDFFENDSVKEQYPHDIKWYFLTDIAHGLLYLHSRSPPVVHRYLTPLTIMLNYNMVAKITSFRHARKTGLIQSPDVLRVLELLLGERMLFVPPEERPTPTTRLQLEKYVELEGVLPEVVPGVARSRLHCDPTYDIYSYATVTLFVLTHVSPLCLASYRGKVTYKHCSTIPLQI